MQVYARISKIGSILGQLFGTLSPMMIFPLPLNAFSGFSANSALARKARIDAIFAGYLSKWLACLKFN